MLTLVSTASAHLGITVWRTWLTFRCAEYNASPLAVRAYCLLRTNVPLRAQTRSLSERIQKKYRAPNCLSLSREKCEWEPGKRVSIVLSPRSRLCSLSLVYVFRYAAESWIKEGRAQKKKKKFIVHDTHKKSEAGTVILFGSTDNGMIWSSSAMRRDRCLKRIISGLTISRHSLMHPRSNFPHQEYSVLREPSTVKICESPKPPNFICWATAETVRQNDPFALASVYFAKINQWDANGEHTIGHAQRDTISPPPWWHERLFKACN